MTRADLDRIQRELKLAIQNHQRLVAQMKNDPQNTNLQRELHKLQSDITSLSEKQKSIVQQLRKELITGTSLGRPPQQPQQHAINLSTNNNNTNNNNVIKTTTAPTTPTVSAHNKTKPQVTMPGKNKSNKPSGGKQAKVVAVSGSGQSSPPLRVPHYTKPSILQGGTHRSVGVLKSPTSGNPPPSVRKGSDSDPNTIKKSSIDKKELSPEERKKLEYMAAIDLITPETLKEIQSRRSERKRRSTANPQFSYGHFEPERRKVARYLTPNKPSPKPVTTGKRRGRPPKTPRTPSKPVKPPITMETDDGTTATTGLHGDTPPVVPGDIHEDYCAECQRSGELLMCDTCNLVYHLACLQPPLTVIPKGLWSCPKCKDLGKTSGGNWPGTLALVHSFITTKNAKQDEKKKLIKKNQDLEGEKSKLEEKAKEMAQTVSQQVKMKSELMASSKKTQHNVDQLQSFIKVFQTS